LIKNHYYLYIKFKIMRNSTIQLLKKSLNATRKCLLSLIVLAGLAGFSQELTPEFLTAGYTLTDLGSIDQLPSEYGGLTIRPAQPNTLYICGYANEDAGTLYTVPLVRDAVTHHITGFGGAAVFYALAPDNDGGLFFAPNGTLLFTRFDMNHLGQILPDNTYITTLLTDYGIEPSVGSIVLVPSGYPGAGNLIIASYDAGIVYVVPYTINGSGQYILSNKTAEVSVNATAPGPEGIAYIPAGSLAFPHLSMVISSYTDGTVEAYEVGTGGLPVDSTAREMVTGLTGAEGALIDPVTGDFLFSTFGGGDKVIRISGFVVPSAVGDLPNENTAGFKLYPNPTQGPVQLELAGPEPAGYYEIFDILGQKIIKQEFSGNSMQKLDLTSQPNGIYFIQVKNGEAIGTQRIVKQ
jgi:hypothetical protein